MSTFARLLYTKRRCIGIRNPGLSFTRVQHDSTGFEKCHFFGALPSPVLFVPCPHLSYLCSALTCLICALPSPVLFVLCPHLSYLCPPLIILYPVSISLFKTSSACFVSCPHPFPCPTNYIPSPFIPPSPLFISTLHFYDGDNFHSLQ